MNNIIEDSREAVQKVEEQLKLIKDNPIIIWQGQPFDTFRSVKNFSDYEFAYRGCNHVTYIPMSRLGGAGTSKPGIVVYYGPVFSHFAITDLNGKVRVLSLAKDMKEVKELALHAQNIGLLIGTYDL